MALAPNTQEFHNIKDALELASEEKRITTPSEAKAYIESMGVDPNEFRDVYKDYRSNQAAYDAQDSGFSAADIIGSTVSKLGSAAGRKAAQAVEVVAGKETRKKFETGFDEAVDYLDNKLKQTELGKAVSYSVKEVFDPKTSTAEDIASDVVGFAALSRVGGKALKRFQPTTTVGKASKYGTIGVGADVLMREEDEQITTELLNLVPEAKPLVERLTINPDDEVAEKLLKQTIDSAVLSGVISGALAGTIKGGSVLIGGGKKIFGKTKALKEGVDEPIANTSKASVKNVEVAETGPNTYRQRGVIQEKIGKINTALGRGLTSWASMPKEIFDSYMNKVQYAGSMDLLVKQLGQRLKTLIDKKEITPELANKILQGEKLTSREIKQVPRELYNEVASMRRAIDSNSKEISNLLGIDPKSKLGIQFAEGEGSYITRQFEFTTNPKWSKDISKAVKGKLDVSNPHNADIIRVVQNAKDHLKKQYKNYSDEEINGLVEQIVKIGKETDSLNAMLSLLGKGGPGNALTQKVLKGRKDIDKPILELLGEVKDPVRNLVGTLTNQNKVIAKAQFLKDIREFAEKNVGQEVELGGLFSFLPKSVATFTKRPQSGADVIKTGSKLSDIAERELGTLGEKRRKLGFGNLSTTEEMYKMLDNGIDVFGIDRPMGKSWTTIMSRPLALGQASETVLDHTAYMVNALGAVQSLAMNGNIFRKGAMDSATKAAYTVWQKAAKKDKEAMQFLQKLKADGIIDSNVVTEGIKTNLDRFGKLGPENTWEKFLEVAVKNPIRKASGVYGGIDDIAKTTAIRMEMNDFARAFPEATEEQIYKMAVDRVRDTMHSYTAAAPIVRGLARLPFGTYATFPAETLRTQYNIIKYGLQDIRKGRELGNEELIRMGYRRLMGLGVTTTGIATAVNAVNTISGTDDNTLRAIKAASPDYQKNTQTAVTTGMYKDPKTNEFMFKSTDTGFYDASQYAQGPIRAIIGRVMAGDDVTERELDEMFSNALTDVYSPYISEKFLTTAVKNVISGYDEQGRPIYPDTGFADNAIAFAKEIGKVFVPGTAKAVKKYMDAVKAEELPGAEGRGVTAAGFPNRKDEAKLFATTGIRNYTTNFSKAMSFSMYEDTKSIDKTAEAFKNYIKNIPQGPLSVEDKKDLYRKYVELQKLKFERMQKLKDKIDVFSNAEYSDGDSKKRIGYDGVLKAATTGGKFKPNQDVINSVAREGVFFPDSLSGKEFIKLLQERGFTLDVIRDLKYIESKLSGKPLRPEEKEEE